MFLMHNAVQYPGTSLQVFKTTVLWSFTTCQSGDETSNIWHTSWTSTCSHSCVHSAQGRSAGRTLRFQSSPSATGRRLHLCWTPWKMSHPWRQSRRPGPRRCPGTCLCPWCRPRWTLAPRGGPPAPPPSGGNWCSGKTHGFVGRYHWKDRIQNIMCLMTEIESCDQDSSRTTSQLFRQWCTVWHWNKLHSLCWCTVWRMDEWMDSIQWPFKLAGI